MIETEGTDSPLQKEALTWRTVIVGFVAMLIFVPFVVYSYTITQSTDLSSDHSTIGAIFFLLVIIVGVNGVWMKVLRRRGLGRAGLLLIFIMLIMPGSAITLGFAESFLPIIVGTTYHKSSGDRYQNIVRRHLSKEIIVTDAEAVTDFMEGLPRESEESLLSWLFRIRWHAFVAPVARWLFFLFAMHFTVVCLVAIFRKQWVERELLTFPLAKLPILLTESSDRSRCLPDLFHNRIFYLGVLLPALLTTMQAIHYYYPNFPVPARPAWSPNLLGYRFTAKFNWVMFGFGYLLSVSSLRGLWLWALVYIVFQAVCLKFGVKFPERLGPFGASGNALFYHAGMGGLIVYAGYTFWVARRHLRDVVAKALGRGPDIDDSGELLAYRTAFWGAIAGFAVMVLWAVRYGVPFFVSLATMAVALTIFITMAKIVAEVGLAECLPPGIPAPFAISKFGPQNIGHTGVFNLVPHISWAGDMRTFTMAAATNSIRIADEFTGSRAKMFCAFFGSLVVGVTVALLTTFLIGNYTGKANTGPNWHAKWLPRSIYDYSLEVLAYQRGPWSPRHTFYVGEKAPEAEQELDEDLEGAPRPLGPAHGEVVATGHPIFEWEPVEGSKRYVLDVFDVEDEGRLVLRKVVHDTHRIYTPRVDEEAEVDTRLKPGRPYQWRVRSDRLSGPNRFGWYASLGGMGLTVALLVLQRQFLWWPLSAIGFIVGGAWIMQHVWFALLVAWAVKAMVLRYGGASAYRKSLPFFMGLIAGQLFTLGLWSVIDLLLGKRGNKLFAF